MAAIALPAPFLLHAERAAQRYGVAAQDILRRCAELELVGGQEDMIIDIAIEMAPPTASV
jgi:4-hydroxy 2-oxovalerate aldolase